jgi:CHAT domain-containing protein
LYDRLLASLVLPAGNSLVIVPHGDLHYLPFQALRSPDGFLIERHPIAVEPSASVAVQLRRRHAEAGGRLVAFGNPVNTAPFDLPAAEREVQSISQMFADHQLYFHENASKSRFREAAGSGRILLVAAHAELDPNDVLASKIRLAAETDDPAFAGARSMASTSPGCR